MQEKRNTKKIQLVTVIAVVVLFILILVLVTLVSQKVQMNAKKKRLVEQDALQQMIENGLEDYEYRQSLEYIEKYAREELGMIDAGDTIWKQAD